MRNPQLFLRGFALDMPPGGCYVWKYMFPLFSTLEFVSLTFGYRLQDGYVDTRRVSKSRALDDILAIIDDNLDFAELESIDEFVSFLDDSRISASDKREGIGLVALSSATAPVGLQEVVEANKRKYGLPVVQGGECPK
jgi:hypothetical protein